MKRLILQFSILVLTFAIGTYANVLVNRAAHHFIPDYDPQPRVQNQIPHLKSPCRKG